MKNHKCNGCRYKGEHHEMMFAPMGVCLKTSNLVEAVKFYNAEKCPFKITNFDKITESVESLAEFIVEETSDLRGSEIIYYAYGESLPTYEKEEAIKSTIEWLQQEIEDEL